MCVFVWGWFKGVIFSREFYAVGIPSACVSVACLHLSLYFLLSLPLTFPCLLPGKKAIFFFFFFPQSMLKHKTSPQFATSHKCPSVSAKALIIVQPLSRVQLFTTSWTTAYQASLSFTISWSLLKLMSTESMMPYNHFILFAYQNSS